MKTKNNKRRIAVIAKLTSYRRGNSSITYAEKEITRHCTLAQAKSLGLAYIKKNSPFGEGRIEVEVEEKSTGMLELFGYDTMWSKEREYFVSGGKVVKTDDWSKRGMARARKKAGKAHVKDRKQVAKNLKKDPYYYDFG